MYDQEMLKPIIVSMVLFLIIAKLIPEIIKKPTGIGIIDDINMLLIAHKDSLAPGAVLTGVITILTYYIIDQEFI
jgi:hypothetical protein